MKKDTDVKSQFLTSVDIRIGDDGELHLTDEFKKRWNLKPGSKLHVEETPQGLFLIPVDQLLKKIYVEPTSECNLNCRTCIRNSWDEPVGSMEMTVYRKLLSDIREIKTLQAMAFWGIGEPLVHPDIVEMVSLAHELGVRTELITNGLLLSRELAKGLIEAGLDTLVISVDGTTQTSYADIRTGGDLRLVQDNIRELNMLRAKMLRKIPEVGIEFVAIKSNIDQLPGLAQIARFMEASFIVVTNLLPCTEDMKDEILYRLSAGVNSSAQRSQFFPELILPRIDLRSEYQIPLFKLQSRIGRTELIRKEIREDNYCPFIQEGSTAITWSGDVSPCIALMHSYRCYVLGREKFIKRYSMGNVAEKKMNNIWDKKEYREFRDRVIKFDFSPCIQCSGCDYTETNDEDCFGNPHPVCGDCLWAKRVLLCP
jgi:tungsten cofactor oxidoreducase radical SAM maturase